MAIDPISDLRRQIEEAAQRQDLAPVERTAKLRVLRGSLEDLLGVLQTYDHDNDLVREADATAQNLALLTARKNASVRDELLRHRQATAKQLDEMGYLSHEDLDRLEEEGLLMESLLSSLRGRAGGGLTSVYDEAKHPRGPGGRWIEVAGKLSKLKDGGRHHVGGDIHVKKVGDLYHVQRKGRVISKTGDVNIAAQRATGEELSVPRKSKAPAISPERARREDILTKSGGPTRSFTAPTRGEANAPPSQIGKSMSPEEKLAAHNAAYEARKAALEQSVRKEAAAGLARLTPAEMHFNQAGKVSQHTLGVFARQAATEPTTIDRHSVVDANGNRVWNESRHALHERIIDTFLRERKFDQTADGGKGAWVLDPNGKPLQGSDHPEVLFTGGGYAAGKALSLDTPIPTPSGWTTMGAVEVGDLVFDERGVPTRVEGVSPVWPDRPVREVVFDDGSVLVADVAHEWLTSTFASRKSKGRKALRVPATHPKFSRSQEHLRVFDTVVETREIEQTLVVSGAQGPKANHAVEVAAPLSLANAVLPVDPYVLGVWLGDGTSTNGNITSGDEEIIWHVRAAGFEVEFKGGYRYSVYGLAPKLREIGLLGRKHVPFVYLRASVEQRMALLAGLMDSDGTVTPSGSAEFCTTSASLCDGTAELLASLGIKFSIRSGRARLYGKDCGPKWTIAFSTDRPVFRLRRKRDKQRVVTDARAGKWARRYIVEVREVAKRATRCITVASESHLFLVGTAMISTHNSSVLKILRAQGREPDSGYGGPALVLDPDQVKAMLPEYQAKLAHDPEANTLVYQEAWAVAQEIQRRAQERRLNMVVDGISNTSPDEMLSRVESFQRAGYNKLRAVYVDIPTEEALARAAARARSASSASDRRMIPEVIMRAVHRDVSATVPHLADLVRSQNIPLSIEVWDNNQGKDENGQFRPPKRMFSQEAGAASGTVEDKALWDRFRGKAHESIPGVPEGMASPSSPVSFKGELGATPFRPGDSASGFYNSPKAKKFEHDVQSFAKKAGVTVTGLDRSHGMWSGGSEPSYRIKAHDGVKNVHDYAEYLRSEHNQDAVVAFHHHDAGQHVHYTVEGVPEGMGSEGQAGTPPVMQTLLSHGIEHGSLIGNELHVYGTPEQGAAIEKVKDAIGAHNVSYAEGTMHFASRPEG